MTEKININELILALLKRWWIIFICAFVFGSAAYGYGRFIQTKQYISVGRMYIDTYRGTGLNGGEGEDRRSSAVINASQSSVRTCIEVMKSKRLLNMVKERSGLDYSASAINNMLTLTAANDTEVLQVKVTCSDYKEAKKLVDAILSVSSEQLPVIVGVATAEIIDEGAENPTPVSPNVRLESIVGALLGAAVAALVIVIILLMDKRIKGEDDLKSYEVAVIGVIPEII